MMLLFGTDYGKVYKGNYWLQTEYLKRKPQKPFYVIITGLKNPPNGGRRIPTVRIQEQPKKAKPKPKTPKNPKKTKKTKHPVQPVPDSSEEFSDDSDDSDDIDNSDSGPREPGSDPDRQAQWSSYAEKAYQKNKAHLAYQKRKTHGTQSRTQSRNIIDPNPLPVVDPSVRFTGSLADTYAVSLGKYNPILEYLS